QLLYIIVHHCGLECQVGSTRTFSDYIFSAPVVAFYNNLVFCLLINFKANKKKKNPQKTRDLFTCFERHLRL
ncbi:hypothetical protein Bpfe_015219, partial [Biomphalaria pfeifferi]